MFLEGPWCPSRVEGLASNSILSPLCGLNYQSGSPEDIVVGPFIEVNTGNQGFETKQNLVICVLFIVQ